MSQKWNLQDIRPPEPRKDRRPRINPKPAERVAQPEAPSPVNTPMPREAIPNIIIENGTKKDKTRLYVSIVLFVVIVGGAIGLSAMMGSTELVVNPKHREPYVSAEFIAYPEKRADQLNYTIITLEATGESQVKATGQIQVEEQATGVIEIKKSTPGAERLIKNTRFRTPDGLVYRIYESVVVPGAVTDETGATVPGSIQAEVFADVVGEKYNIPAGQKFDVPGFEENGLTALYSAITATNPAPMTGGYSGPQYQIDPNELSTARQALQVQLRDTLLARVPNEMIAGHVYYPEAVAITYNELPAVEYRDSDGGKDLVTIKEQAVLQVPLFEEIQFGSFIAKETVPTYAGEPVRVQDPATLTFSYTNPTTSSSVLANETSIKFSLTGKPLLIWEYDKEKLATDLKGLPKTALENIIKNGEAYPGIDKATARITPFWQRTFPQDPEEIVIIEELEMEE